MVYLRYAGTDRLERDGNVKEFRGKFFHRCTFETFGVMALIVGGGES